jgi:hypothetical protein
MAEIKFYANIVGTENNTLIDHTAGSGIGFYGSSFGVSVPVQSRQRTTYVTDSNGTNSGIQLNNTAMNTVGSTSEKGTVKVNGTDAVDLDFLGNHQCPLNIRFSHDTAVSVQNCRLRIFDRNNINNAASGVTTYVYEARHPSPLNSNNTLSYRADTANVFRWKEFYPPAQNEAQPNIELALTNSPGISGTNTIAQEPLSSGVGKWITNEGDAHASMRHDWYLALSSEPESIGSKTQYGLYFTVEYL